MILATWNVNNGQHADRLAQVQGDFQADLIVLQETAAPPAGAIGEWVGDRPSKGVSFDSCFPYERVGLSGDTSPCIAARITDSPLGAFNVLAVWAKPLNDSYYADLTRTFDLYSDFIRERPTVVLGDFNMMVQIAGKGRREFDAMSRRLSEEFGVVSAYHAHTGEPFGEEVSPTHFHQWRADRPFHCDFIYLPTAWTPRVKAITVPGFGQYGDSDHRPVVATVD